MVSKSHFPKNVGQQRSSLGRQYSSGGCETQIDYHLCSRQLRSWVKDCKVILGESLVSQHRLLVTDFYVKSVDKQNKKHPTSEKKDKVAPSKQQKCQTLYR